jgi:DNA-binding transcriptional MocR family regulator
MRGLYLVMLLPDDFRDTVVAEKAARSDISTVPLSICYQEEPRKQGLILGYAGEIKLRSSTWYQSM